MTSAVSSCCGTKVPDEAGGYDLAVIGAGSAGFAAAIAGAEHGARVALIGHGTIGGTCVNVGCVPSKTLIRATEALHHARAASRFGGIRGQAEVTDWRATVARKDELVGTLRQAKYIDLLPHYNTVAYIEGRARLADGGVTVDGRHLRARKVVVATGASAAVPDIAGIDDVPYLTSTTALDLEALPRSLLVVGGGYVGAELAQMFARAGVAVTVVCRSRLLPKAEPEIGGALAGYFRDEGITVVEGAHYQHIARAQTGVALSLAKDGKTRRYDAEQVLVATGRHANTGGLGLDEAGVLTTGNGGIRVDDRMRTSRDGVYAAGDVIGRDQFVYMAAHGARIAAENALNGDARRYDATAMPAVVFTDPQLASVGLTEGAARAQGIAVRSSVLALEHVPRARAARDTRGLIKLVADEAGGLIGAHILAPEGADSIQTAALAIRQGLDVADLADMIFPYLTTVEGLKLAAQAFETDVTRLSCCAS